MKRTGSPTCLNWSSAAAAYTREPTEDVVVAFGLRR